MTKKSKSSKKGHKKTPTKKTGSDSKSSSKKSSKKKTQKGIQKDTRTKGIIAGIIIILLALVIAYSSDLFSDGQGTAESAEEVIVATVNGEDITLEELNREYQGISPQQKAAISKKQVLNDSMIPSTLLLQEAKEYGISVGEDDAESYLANFMNESGMTSDQLEQQLSQRDLTMEEFIQLYTERMMIIELLNETVPAPEATDEEIEQFYEQNKNSFAAGNQTVALEDVEDQIRSLIEGQKRQQMIAEYIDALTEKAQIEIFPENIKSSDEEGAGGEESPNLATGNAAGSEVIDSSSGSDSPSGDEGNTGGTFSSTGEDICYEDGKPVVLLFSTTQCPHCTWISDTFDSVAREYMDEGKIVARHWQMDTKDNTLTSEEETEVPMKDIKIFQKYSQGAVPFFSFGCKYIRLGNGYESQDNLKAEEEEFRKLIQSLVSA
ncbi:MAG: SurA N-terminal domain-containing protein [Candidatus Woesearchaeota archaeon]